MKDLRNIPFLNDDFAGAATIKIAKVRAVQAQGLPARYNNMFEWAREWVQQNGMTLPPDTDDYRSLRNWFCYKLSQFKKKKLGARNEALLVEYGLDLSQYEALNTGKGERESDKPYVDQLQAHFKATGSYDLLREHQVPTNLLRWQEKLIDRFQLDGISRRMRDLQLELPGLHYGLWRRPSTVPPSEAERAWWKHADQYDELAARFPAYQGNQHPGMPQDMQMWGHQQQVLASSGALPTGACGWMRGVGLLVNTAREKAGQERREASKAFEEVFGTSDDHAGSPDRSLRSLLGCISAIHAVQKGLGDREVMVDFRIAPAVVVDLRAFINARAEGTRWSPQQVAACRRVLRCGYFDSDGFRDMVDQELRGETFNFREAVVSLYGLARVIHKEFGPRSPFFDGPNVPADAPKAAPISVSKWQRAPKPAAAPQTRPRA